MEISTNKIKKILSETSSLGKEVLNFSDDLSLTKQGVDSLDSLDFFLKIEESYGISIPDNDIDKLSTVNQICKYLESKIK
jgi:acyl carrier protein